MTTNFGDNTGNAFRIDSGNRDAWPAAETGALASGPAPGVFGQASLAGEVGLLESRWIACLEGAGYFGARKMLYCLLYKRWIDMAAACVLLAVAAPLLLAVALTIRLERRTPVVFRQSRIGRNGRPFLMYKFCTMIPDRRKVEGALSDNNRRQRHKSRNDPRVTTVGRVLRVTSLDELPQLVNVLRGEMSLVGPRPELPAIVARYAPWQHSRHLIRPGITGWWQVQGRSDRPMHENTELDIYYVANQSFRLDVEIVLRTVGALFRRSGAY